MEPAETERHRFDEPHDGGFDGITWERLRHDEIRSAPEIPLCRTVAL